MTTKNRNARLSEALLQIVGDNARGFSPRATNQMAVLAHGNSSVHNHGSVASWRRKSGCSIPSRATRYRSIRRLWNCT